MEEKKESDILFVGSCNNVLDLEDAVAYLTPFVEDGIRINLTASRLDSGEASAKKEPML